MAAVGGGGGGSSKKKRVPAARQVVKSIRKAGGTTNEGLGVLREVRATGRGKGNAVPYPTNSSATNRADVYRAGRIVQRESGRAAAMKFNTAVARVEANQVQQHPVEKQSQRDQAAWLAQVNAKTKGRM